MRRWALFGLAFLMLCGLMGCSKPPTKHRYLVFHDVSGSASSDLRRLAAGTIDSLIEREGGESLFKFWMFDDRVHWVASKSPARAKEIWPLIDECVLKYSSKVKGTYLIPVLKMMLREAEKAPADEQVIGIILTDGGFNDRQSTDDIIAQVRNSTRLEHIVVGPVLRVKNFTGNNIVDDVHTTFDACGDKVFIFTEVEMPQLEEEWNKRLR